MLHMFHYYFGHLKGHIIAPRDFYNCKCFFNVVVQNVCNTNKIFWSVHVGQPNGVHDGGQFRYSTLYR
jgi:hypothetical protein